jgi:hypothetical protein
MCSLGSNKNQTREASKKVLVMHKFMDCAVRCNIKSPESGVLERQLKLYYERKIYFSIIRLA